MAVLSYLLGQEVTIERCRGSTATGSVYGAPVAYQAAVDLSQKRLVNDKGEVVASLGEVLLNPDAEIGVGDRVEYEGRKYAAVIVNPVRVGKRLHHYEVTLGRLA